jgi:hypothetical protein
LLAGRSVFPAFTATPVFTQMLDRGLLIDRRVVDAPNHSNTLTRKPLPIWEIYLARSTPAKYVGTVEAVDAEAATKAAIKEFSIAEPQAKRLIAVRRA